MNGSYVKLVEEYNEQLTEEKAELTPEEQRSYFNGWLIAKFKEDGSIFEGSTEDLVQLFVGQMEEFEKEVDTEEVNFKELVDTFKSEIESNDEGETDSTEVEPEPEVAPEPVEEPAPVEEPEVIDEPSQEDEDI